jgi:MtN3 and saliva related transmembrane protein
MEDWILLGITAGFLTTIGFVPQIIKSVRTRRMEEVSLMMPLLLSLGMFLWSIYGVLKADWAIILWNVVALVLNLSLVGLKFHYRRHEGTTRD